MRLRSRYKAYFIVIIALSAISLHAYAQTNLPPTPAVSSSWVTAVDVVNNIVNMLFFLVVGVIGLLSYLQARKTIFTPMKTETFKLQLKLFKEMILFFEEFKQKGVDAIFHQRKTLEVNFILLLDAYVGQFFKSQIEVLAEKRAKLLNKYSRAIVSLEVAGDWELVDDYIQTEKMETKPEVVNPAVILAQWQKFKYGPTHYPDEFHDRMVQLDHFRGSPLVPSKIRDLVTDFKKEAHENLSAVEDVLTSVAQELPEKYPDPDSIKKAQVHWVWNKYTTKRTLMDQLPDKILKHINEYLDVDRRPHTGLKREEDGRTRASTPTFHTARTRCKTRVTPVVGQTIMTKPIQPSEESLRTQFVEVHERAKLHASRLWQLPFVYIGIIGVSF